MRASGTQSVDAGARVHEKEFCVWYAVDLGFVFCAGLEGGGRERKAVFVCHFGDWAGTEGVSSLDDG